MSVNMMKRALGFLVAAVVLAASNTSVAGTVEFWSFLDPKGDDIRGRTLKQVLDKFEAANPNIEVNTTVFAWNQLSPTLLRAARARQVPDAVMMYSPLMGVHIAAGSLLPLNDYVKTWPDERVKDTVMFKSSEDKAGNIYGLPWEMRVFGFLYRTDLFEKADMAVPQNLVELGEAVGKIAKSEDVSGFGFGFGLAEATGTMEWFIPTAVGMGAKVLNEDGTAAFVSPEMEKLLIWVRDQAEKTGALSQNIAMMGSEEIQQIMVAGRLMVVPKGTHRVSTMREQSGLDEKLGWMPYPSFEEGGRTPAMVTGWNVVIPKHAKNPEDAWKLIDYWTGPEAQLLQAQAAGYLPMRNSVSKDPAFNDEAFEYIKRALEHASGGTMDFNWPENTALLYKTLAAMMQEVLINKVSPREGLEKAENEYNKAIR